jgi:hypothetical protein
MNAILIIFIVAVTLCMIRKAWALSSGRKRREMQELVRRRKEDAEREELMCEVRHRMAKTGHVDWERRYSELVEIVATRTDQAKGEK